jgi:ribonuclease P protein component
VPHGRLPSSLRFPRSARLLKHSDFERVYKQGRRHFSPHLTAFYLLRQSGDLSGPRVGFTVGRVLGGAVERNRIKRRLREAVRLNLAALSAPVDVVINPKKSVLDLEFAQLRDEIRRAVDVVQQKSRREPD